MGDFGRNAKGCLILLFNFAINILIGNCCSDCGAGSDDCSPSKYKCVDNSPLCPTLEILCENYFFRNCARKACPYTCKVCETHEHPSISTTTTTTSAPSTPPFIINTTTFYDVPTSTGIVGSTTPMACNPSVHPLDLIMVLDGSASIGDDIFNKQILDFTRQLARSLNISATGNRMALVQFSDWATVEFGLDKHTDIESVEKAISAIKYMDGGTETGKALELVLREVLPTTRKSPAAKMIIVVTDGNSYDDVETPAKKLQNDQANIIAVGVGEDVSKTQLELIANGPENVYTISDFNKLDTLLITKLTTKICDNLVEAYETTNNITNDTDSTCSSQSPKDVVLAFNLNKPLNTFLFNERKEIYGQVIDVVQQLGQMLNVSKAGNHLALARNANHAGFEIIKYQDQKNLSDAIGKIKPDSYVNILSLLTFIRKELLKNARIKLAKQFVVLITDDTPRNNAYKAAVNEIGKIISQNNATVVTVGIGPDSFLNAEAIFKYEGNGLQRVNFADFEEFHEGALAQLRKLICTGK